MFSHLLNKVKLAAQRHYVRVMAFAVVGGVCAATVFLLPSVFHYNVVEAPIEKEEFQGGIATSTFARSAPVRLVAKTIDLDTEFEAPLTLNEDKTVSVPDSYEKVGWYMHGATPGEIGPSVILGHVDSYEGPAIFYKIGKLKEGDEIAVTRADGSTAVFVVTESERISQDDFPTEKVYGQIEYAGLRLVTCTGRFDKSAQKYSHNLVVYARLKE